MGTTSDIIRKHLEELAPSSNLDQSTTPEAYNDIILTDEEKEEWLRRGREDKFRQQKIAEYNEKLKTVPMIRLTALDLWNRLKQTKSMSGKAYRLDDHNKEIIKLLCLYFSRDPQFEQLGYSLDKGIALVGPVGCGKSHLMSFFMHNINASYAMASCRQIVDRWINHKGDKDESVNPIIHHFSNLITTAVNQNIFRHSILGVCFDDLGTETCPAKNYGNENNVMAEIILNRYDNQLPMNMTHIVTNKSTEELEKAYGTRFRNRLKEQCNYIPFQNEAKSRR